MPNLQVSFQDKETRFCGNSKKECLSCLKNRLENSQDSEIHNVIIESDYKETRKIVCRNFDEQNIPEWDEGMNYGVEINENGVGELRMFATKDQMIDLFVRIAADKGNHWG